MLHFKQHHKNVYMSVKTYTQLSTEAQTIATETTAGANTASRVGDTLQDIVDSVKLVTKVTLSSSDILNLHTTPKTLIASPGVGKCIASTEYIYVYNYLTSDYSAGATISLKINANSTSSGINSLFGIGESCTTQKSAFLSGTKSNCENEPLTLTTSSAITSGDGTIDVYISYKILSI